MSFTIWGLLIIPFTFFLLFIKGIKGIYQALIITSPLFITVITTIPIGSTILRTSYLFAVIYIVSYISILGARNQLFVLKKDLLPAYTFLAIITISLIMPFLLANEVSVISFESSVGMVNSLSIEKLSFKESNITQIIYPYFQVILFVSITYYASIRNKVRETLRLLIKGSMIVLFSGFLHIVFVQIGETSLLEAINLIISGSTEVKLSKGKGFMGLARMHSWAGEPGYSAFLFLAIVGLLLGEWLSDNYILSKNRKLCNINLLLFTVGIILSAGTTGYIGILVVFLLTFFASLAISQFKLKSYYLFWPIVSLVVVFILLQSFWDYSFVNYFQEQHLSKLTELKDSGYVRFTIIKQNILNFLNSPILGVGYGSERSLALSAFLLSNTGLLGFLSFSFFGAFLMRKMWNILRSRLATANQKTLALGLFISFGTMFVLMQFAKSESSLLFHYFWIIGACMLALHRLYKQKKRSNYN